MDAIATNTGISTKEAAKLVLFFEMADLAFQKYLPNKFLLHALCIRKSNEAIYLHLAENACFWPAAIQMDVVQLLNHYDIWFSQFDDFRNQKSFELNEPFVFYHLDDQSAYPKNSAKVIYDYCKMMAG
ncbi:MAG: hypothetical protein EOO13_01385 [Chitinophagaceae bacterium]|nr:MAG: hypothetical protein EOO13_01385 [Chitinophagaceae bacterium]